ncbi:MAG: hypothetical protein ACYTF0_09545, partial [Planctomycetota bacterium]
MRTFLAITMMMAIAAALGLAAAEQGTLRPADVGSKGVMERPLELGRVWRTQKSGFAGAADAAPVIAGCFLWGGRADQDYKPFHQWEILVYGGLQPIAAVEMQVQPLGKNLKPYKIPGGAEWLALGDLAAEQRRTCSYKLNCSAPSAYRVEFRWDDGAGGKAQATYVGLCDQSLPQRLGDERPMIVVTGVEHDYNKRKRLAEASFVAHNLGAVAARKIT